MSVCIYIFTKVGQSTEPHGSVHLKIHNAIVWVTTFQKTKGVATVEKTTEKLIMFKTTTTKRKEQKRVCLG
jgi:hypothetical protein